MTSSHYDIPIQKKVFFLFLLFCKINVTKYREFKTIERIP